MLRSVLFLLLTVLLPLTGFTLTNGPVRANSTEERLFSKALVEVLTTPTGCQIAEKFFHLKEQPLRKFFGINAEAAKTIAALCPGKDLPTLSLFAKIRSDKRPHKTYTLTIGDKSPHFHGWTSADNTTHVFLKYYDPLILRRILAHELLITMDDKFHLQTPGFEKLGVPSKFSDLSRCQIDRFLSNPFHQSLLASLRAFRMELLFAAELKDQDWLKELKSYPFLSDEATENFDVFLKLMQPFQVSILRAYSHYYDDCTRSQIAIGELSDQTLKALIERDWNAIKNGYSKKAVENLMTLLIMQMAISNSDSNAVNSGPRPVIGTGGWAKEAMIQLPESIKVTIPQKGLLLDQGKKWEIYHKNRYEQILNEAPQFFGVPTKDEKR